MAVKKRDFLFDNYKVLLIFLVVVGHFTDLCANNNPFLYTLKWLISAFHMPAFIFVSGYFSKKDAPITKLIEKLLIPYFIYECLYYLLYTFVLHKHTGLYLIYPKFSLWYILALFVWRLVTPYVKKIPHHMILAIAAGLLIGCSDMKDNFLSLPRILVFYPYFLAGIHFDRDMLSQLRSNPKYRKMAAGIITAFIAFLILDPIHKTGSVKAFYGRYNYDFLGLTPVQGIAVRLLVYLVGFGLTYAIAILMTEKELKISYIGIRTMPVYLFHGLLYSAIKFGTNILPGVNTALETTLLLGFCVVITLLFASKPLYDFTNAVAGVKLESLEGTTSYRYCYTMPCRERHSHA